MIGGPDGCCSGSSLARWCFAPNSISTYTVDENTSTKDAGAEAGVVGRPHGSTATNGNASWERPGSKCARCCSVATISRLADVGSLRYFSHIAATPLPFTTTRCAA